MSDSEGRILYYPAPKTFSDTGFITHSFNDGSYVTARVKESHDYGGYLIELKLNNGKEDICNVTVDKFAALCIIDVLNRNIINQEDLETDGYILSDKSS